MKKGIVLVVQMCYNTCTNVTPEGILYAKTIMTTPYKHHSYVTENKILATIFRLSDSQLKDWASPTQLQKLVEGYIGLTAPTVNGYKSAIVTVITLMARRAIDMGANDMLCFRMAEMYRNQLDDIDDIQLLLQLLAEILQKFRRVAEGRYPPKIISAIMYIKGHIHQNCKVSQVAQHIGVDSRYFAKLFRQYVGVSPSQYITTAKLQCAVSLMDKGYTVAKTCNALAYFDLAHFCRCFKAQYGITPSAYCRQLHSSIPVEQDWQQ